MSKLLDMILRVGVNEALDRLLDVSTKGRTYNRSTCRWMFSFIGNAGELTMHMSIEFDENAYLSFGSEQAQRDHQAWVFGARKIRNAMDHKIGEIMRKQVNFNSVTAPEGN